MDFSSRTCNFDVINSFLRQKDIGWQATDNFLDLAYFATRVSDMSDTRATRVTHECNTNDTSATRVKNFDFDNDTSENIFSHPYINYIANERLQERNNFILRTIFWKCLVPMPVEKCTRKTELYNGKSYIKKLNTRL